MLNLKNPKGYKNLPLEKQFKTETLLKSNDLALQKMEISEIREIVRFQAKQIIVAETRLLQLKEGFKDLGNSLNNLKGASIDNSLVTYEGIDIDSIDTAQELSSATKAGLETFLKDQLEACKESDKSSIVEALQSQSVVTYIMATRLAAVEDVLEEFIREDS